MNKNYASYFIGLKILLKNENQFLFLKDKETQKLDLPGGRINETECHSPLKQILQREIKEELGDKIKYKLGEILFNYRRIRKNKKIKIFMVIYEAQYLGGKIKLSDEHTEFIWLNPKKYNFKNDFDQEELKTLKNFFNK